MLYNNYCTKKVRKFLKGKYMTKKELIVRVIKLLTRSLTCSGTWEINYCYLSDAVALLLDAMMAKDEGEI